MRIAILSLILCCLLTGCVSTRSQQDIGAIEQGSYNAAESLPQSPQTVAIEANAVTVGEIVGQPITTVSATASVVAGATP